MPEIDFIVLGRIAAGIRLYGAALPKEDAEELAIRNGVPAHLAGHALWQLDSFHICRCSECKGLVHADHLDDSSTLTRPLCRDCAS